MAHAQMINGIPMKNPRPLKKAQSVDTTETLLSLVRFSVVKMTVRKGVNLIDVQTQGHQVRQLRMRESCY